MNYLDGFFDSPTMRVFLIPAIFLAATLFAAYYGITTEINKRAKLRSDQLLAAFRGEINALKPALCSVAEKSYQRWKDSNGQIFFTPWKSEFPYPVFQSNASNLGELNDVQTTEQLVKFYVVLARALESADRANAVPVGTTKQQEFLDYLHGFSSACSLSILLSAKFDKMLPESISMDRFLEQGGTAEIKGEDERHRELMNTIREEIGRIKIQPPTATGSEKN